MSKKQLNTIDIATTNCTEFEKKKIANKSSKFSIWVISIWCFLNSFISIYFWCSILALTDFLYTTFYVGIDREYSRCYFIGSFISFMCFNLIAKMFKFNTRMILI